MPKTKKPTGMPPAYSKARMFDAYISIVQFQFRAWQSTLELFLKNPMNIGSLVMTRNDMMRLVAGELFDALYDASVLNVYSGLAGLLDKEYSLNDQSRANLVLRRVIDDIGPTLGTPERSAVENDFAMLKRLADPITQSRNKAGAHLDLMIAIAILDHHQKGAPYPLPLLNVGQLEQIMELLARITDAIVSNFSPRLQWRPKGINVDVLFDTLRRGLNARREAVIEKADINESSLPPRSA